MHRYTLNILNQLYGYECDYNVEVDADSKEEALEKCQKIDVLADVSFRRVKLYANKG